MFVAKLFSPRIKEILRSIRYILINSNYNFSYSQEGEDGILLRYFRNKPKGFFVDVGAHHPRRFSNTYLLYQLGWRGINIDAMPGSMEKFKAVRPKDINIEAAISDVVEVIPFYVFEEKAINTFSKELADERIRLGWELKEVINITTKTLTEIIDAVAIDKKISLLSIDVEGLDFNVLRSLDWSRYRPHIVIIEELNGFDFKNLNKNPIYIFLQKLEYEFFAKTYNSIFFINNKSAKVIN